MKKYKFLFLIILFFNLNLIAKSLPQQEKLVLLNVQTTGCGWCKKMQRDVFDNPKVMQKLKSKFKVLVLNTETNASLIPSFLNPSFFPTTYILTPDMKKLKYEFLGYMNAKDLLNVLDIEH